MSARLDPSASRSRRLKVPPAMVRSVTVMATTKFCSDDFIPECNLEKNAIHKCTRRGTPELVTKCNSLQTCISLSDGTICANKNCWCTEDGIACGKIFPQSCLLQQHALYSCTKGKGPVLKEDCGDRECRSFKSPNTVSNDQCAKDCTCAKQGMVSLTRV